MERENDIPDFSDLTCTNLMIRLKILLKKTPPETPVAFFVRRDQKDTVEVPFSRSGYVVNAVPAGTNRYRIVLRKK